MTDVDELVAAAIDEIAAAETAAELDSVRVGYLGKKGHLTLLLRQLGGMTPEQRPIFGDAINGAKQRVAAEINQRREHLQQLELAKKLAQETIDVTLSGRGDQPGGLHPITRTQRRIESLFQQLGFEIHAGPELEDDYHNFEALNIPADHPARAMHDTLLL